MGKEEETERAKYVPKQPPEFALPRITYARINTVCGARILYEYRDAVLAVATIFIALFTLTLWLSTRRSVEVLPRIERAYVFLSNINKHDSGWRLYAEGLEMREFTATFANRGKTPAIIKKVRFGYMLSDNVPQTLTQIEDRPDLPDGLVIASNKKWKTEPITVRRTVEEGQDMSTLGKILYFVGVIEYRDIIGDKRETGFCWQMRVFASGTTDIILCRASKLNYAE